LAAGQNSAIVLARVSSKEQQAGFSLASQVKFLTAYAREHQLRVVKTFLIAETASRPEQRKIFNSAIAYAEECDIKNIVGEKVDRLTRNDRDKITINDWIGEDPDRKVHFVKNSLVLHRHSRSQERLNLDISVALAKNQVDNLREEVAKGVAEKLSQGWMPGRYPVGYKTIGRKSNAKIIIDPDKAPLVSTLFELYLHPDQSISSVTAEMRRRGLMSSKGTPLPRSMIAKMLRHKFYLGLIPWDGDVYPGLHPAIIKRPVFDAVQNKLETRHAPRRRTHTPLFRGMVRCGDCDSSISWGLHKGRYYGRCESKKPCTRRSYIREDRLERRIVSLFDKLLSPWQEIATWVADELENSQAKEREARRATIKQLRERRELLLRRESIAYEDRLDGRISSQRYDGVVVQIRDERVAVENELSRLDGSSVAEAIKSEARFLDLCQRAADIYRRASNHQRRTLLGLLFLNLRLEGDNLAYEWQKSAQVILEAAEEDRNLHSRLERVVHGLVERKEALMRASLSLWCAKVSESGTYSAGRNSTSMVQLSELLSLVEA
jgi:site-specific DNA recombinase